MPLYYTSVDRCFTLAPKVGSVSTLTSADILAFCVDAEALVHAKIANAYTVPIVPAPPLLAMLSTDIAVYRLLGLRLAEGDNATQWMARLKESLALLDKISDGSVTLTTDSGTVIGGSDAASGIIADYTAFRPTMNELPEVEQSIDPDYLDALRGEQ